jgi:O-acetyl-ADP-ribose deacetylase (regulator of RNase III)
MITYLEGDATQPVTSGPKIIAHVCNDIGGWGRGFVLALSARWPEPEAEYRRWFKEGGPIPFVLGNVQFVDVETRLWVANMIGQRHIKPINDAPPVRYDALRMGLSRVAQFAREQKATVHVPRIGCGLAGGTWEKVEPIILETLVSAGVDVFVYDLSQ